MISKNTVLVLGAGASAPFGFPLGKELINIVYSSLEYAKALEPKELPLTKSGYPVYGNVVVDDDTRSSNKLVNLILSLGHTREDIEKFRTSLIQSQLDSVDAFLEHRPEFISIGKLAIAYVLLKYENIVNILKNPDWYRYVWNKLNTSYDNFENNRLSIVTFNYDRSLEYYLYMTFTATFGKSHEETVHKLRSIKIIHLHGKLGNLPWESINYTKFGEEIKDDEKLLDVSNNIKIIHEDIDNDKEFSLAYELMENAEQIFFLGFGYSEINLKRLKISNISSTQGFEAVVNNQNTNGDMQKLANMLPNLKYIDIGGTAYGLTEAEVKAVNKLIPGVRAVNFDRNNTCLDFLRSKNF